MTQQDAKSCVIINGIPKSGTYFTASGETHKIGQYHRYFTDEHYQMFDNDVFRKMLTTFGYEWEE